MNSQNNINYGCVELCRDKNNNQQLHIIEYCQRMQNNVV